MATQVGARAYRSRGACFAVVCRLQGRVYVVAVAAYAVKCRDQYVSSASSYRSWQRGVLGRRGSTLLDLCRGMVVIPPMAYYDIPPASHGVA